MDKYLDDDVDKNKFGHSNWHIDATTIWPLPADQRKIAAQVALQNISDKFAAVLFPLHYTLRHLANALVMYSPDGTITTTSAVFGGLPIQLVNVMGMPVWPTLTGGFRRTTAEHLQYPLRMVLHRLRFWKDTFVSFGITLAETTSENSQRDLQLPDGGCLYLVRHFLVDMMQPTTYSSVYWVVFRRCLYDMLRDLAQRRLLKAYLIVIMKGKRSDMALVEAMLHTAHRHLLGESLCNTYAGGLQYMFTDHGVAMAQPSESADDICFLYGIAFNRGFIAELELRILSLYRSKGHTRPQRIMSHVVRGTHFETKNLSRG